MKDLAVTLLQADLYWEQKEANMAMFEELIWQTEETDLIVLPEMFTTGFSMHTQELAEPPGGKTYRWMKQMAGQKRAALVGSYIVKEKGLYYNRCYFVKPDGSSQHYDKKHLFSLAGETKHYEAGREKVIIEYMGWKIKPLVCYDLRFPVWSSNATPENPDFDLLIFVANWPETRIQAWDSLLQARAIENQAYCLGVNRTGSDASQKSYPGHSATYSFLGDQLTFSQEKQAALQLILNKESQNAFRSRYPFYRDTDQFDIL